MTARGDASAQDRSSWAGEALALARGASGGLLFGVPLLYTMEMWWIGSHTSPRQMLFIIAALFAILVVLNTTAGFREERDVAFFESAEDSVQALAVGIVMTAAVLFVLRQITIDTPATTALGRVLIECVPFCLGVGVARFLLQGDPGLAKQNGEGEGRSADDPDLDNGAADIGATVLGAAFVALSIAPTDEVPMLAAGMSPVWLVVLVAASLAISHAVVFVAGFAGQDRRRQQQGVFQRPLTETLVTYVVALVVAALLLFVFQRDLDPVDDLLARVIVLGLPAAVGGAVGRLAL